MSSHLSIVTSWTGAGFRENPEQGVSSLLTYPARDQQEKKNHVSTSPHPEPRTLNPSSIRRNP